MKVRTPELTYCWLHWEVIGRLVKAHQDSIGWFLKDAMVYGFENLHSRESFHILRLSERG